MLFGKINNQPLLSVRIAAVTLSLAGSVILTACGGGGGSGSLGGSGNVPYVGTGFKTRPLAAEFTSRQAVNYSPFRTNNRDTEIAALGTNPGYSTMKANILQDLILLQAGNIRLIRVFDSASAPVGAANPNGDGVAKMILDVIKDNNLDIKVQQGIWINGVTSTDVHLSPAQNQAIIDAAKLGNEQEISRGVKLANDYCLAKNVNAASCIVLAVSVGNERMVNWSANMDPVIVADYITKARNQVVQPVTSDDDWAFWAQVNGNHASPTPVLNAVDFVSMHTYPLSETPFNQWDWKQASVSDPTLRAKAMMDASIVRAKADYAAVRSNLDAHGRTDLPITIGETGWRAFNTYSPDTSFRSNTVNQKMYFVGLNDWNHASKLVGGPANIFNFEAFDEPWKGGDDKWGLFNVARQARCAVQALSVSFTPEAGSCAATTAAYWTPAIVKTVGTNQYTLYADTATAGEVKPLIWWELVPNAFTGNGPTVGINTVDTSTAVEGANSILLSPSPASWGWGVAFVLTPRAPDFIDAANLSQLAYLNLSIKTSYAGKIEVGFVTGRGSDSSGYEVFMQLASGQYGYINDGAWHTVKIPLSTIITAGTAVAGQPDNHGNSVDLALVSQPLVIADRYKFTGNLVGATTPINIDKIYWSVN